MKILLIGDSCYDIYRYGNVNRISPEAPIPVFDYTHEEVKKGMASNVHENLQALGAQVHIVTEFIEEKIRYVDKKSGHQLLRVDQKIGKGSYSDTNHIPYEKYDAIVISDYGKGFFDRRDYETIRGNFDGPIFIDTKDTYLDFYEGAIVKINQHEYEKSDKGFRLENLIVTYGGEKVTWQDKTFYPPKVDAHDVCGAGDTFLSALAFEYIRKNSLEDAIEFAMKASAITVQHVGVYAPNIKEIDDDKT